LLGCGVELRVRGGIDRHDLDAQRILGAARLPEARPFFQPASLSALLAAAWSWSTGAGPLVS
jgi:hypothetical protein